LGLQAGRDPTRAHEQTQKRERKRTSQNGLITAPQMIVQAPAHSRCRSAPAPVFHDADHIGVDLSFGTNLLRDISNNDVEANFNIVCFGDQ
jgi:hypothetical protein